MTAQEVATSVVEKVVLRASVGIRVKIVVSDWITPASSVWLMSDQVVCSRDVYERVTALMKEIQ